MQRSHGFKGGLFPAAITDSLCHVWKLLFGVMIGLFVGRDVGTDLTFETSTTGFDAVVGMFIIDGPIVGGVVCSGDGSQTKSR